MLRQPLHGMIALARNERRRSSEFPASTRSGTQSVPARFSRGHAADLDGRSCSVALLYDMLHFIDAPERRELYQALRELLAVGGLLSVHMKHVKGNDPGRYFLAMSAEDVASEIEAAGFRLSRRLPARIWHSHGTENGLVWNFVKR